MVIGNVCETVSDPPRALPCHAIEHHIPGYNRFSFFENQVIDSYISCSKTYLTILTSDKYGTYCVLHDVRRTGRHVLRTDTLPATAEELPDNSKLLNIVFAPIDISEEKPHDRGRPSFLHPTHCANSCGLYAIERVGMTTIANENGVELKHWISSDKLNTAEIRASNDGFLRTGVKRHEMVESKEDRSVGMAFRRIHNLSLPLRLK